MRIKPKGNRGTVVVHLKQDDPFSDPARFSRSAVVVMMNSAGIIDRDLVFARPCQDGRSGDDDHVSRVSRSLRGCFQLPGNDVASLRNSKSVDRLPSWQIVEAQLVQQIEVDCRSRAGMPRLHLRMAL